MAVAARAAAANLIMVVSEGKAFGRLSIALRRMEKSKARDVGDSNSLSQLEPGAP
jgi:hypothetical protein